MKKSIFFAALMMGAFMFTACDKGGTPETDKTNLWPASEDDSSVWGYFNGKDSKLEIRAKYYPADPFSCGLARVKEDTDWKFIDKSGKPLSGKMPELYNQSAPGTFYYDLSVISIDDNIKAFMGKDFKTTTNQEFVELDEMTEDGLAAFRLKDETLKGYCDKTGEPIIKAEYDEAEPFMDGIAVVTQVSEDRTTTTYIIIDKNGNELYSQKSVLENKGEGRVAFKNSTTKKWGLLDKAGNEIVSAKYGSIDEFHNGLAKVRKYTDNNDGKYGYIDVKGNEIIDLIYTQGMECSEGLIWVKKANDGKWLLIDKNGNEKFELSKGQSPDNNYHNGLCLVSSSRKKFYIDTKNDEKYSWKTGSNGGYNPDEGGEGDWGWPEDEVAAQKAKVARLTGTKYGPKAEYDLKQLLAK